MIALALLVALGGLGLWLGFSRGPSSADRGSVVPRTDGPTPPHVAVAVEGGDASASQELRDPDPTSERSDAPIADDGELPVELWVRLIETIVLQPRSGELRPTQRGVAGMSVTWNGSESALSDADGLVRFPDLPPRAGELRVQAQGGLHGWSGTLDLAAPSGGLRRAGSRLTFEIELRANLGSFGGRLSDASGEPVAGAWVALVRGDTSSRRSSADGDLLAPAVQSDAQGAFELPRVQGEERLELLICCARAGLPAGHVRPLNTHELAATAPLDIRLPAARSVHVRVLTADGAPADGSLCLQRDGTQWPADCEGRLARTPAAAEARLRSQLPGELRVELDDGPWVVHFLPAQPSQSRRLFQFTLRPGGETRFEFRLP